MFRGFRWQLIALMLAVAAFAAGAVYRISRQPAPPPKSTAMPTPSSTASTFGDPPETTAVPPGADTGSFLPETPSYSVSTTYREGMVGTIQRLNPLFAHLNPPDRDISSLIFEGLFAINDYGEVVPSLAAELVVSGDGLEYVVRLRDDITWQDGIAFSADDVAFTMSLLSAPEYAEFSPAGEFWQTVETQWLSQDLVRFRLAQPFSSFPHLLTIGILPEHALRGSTVAGLVHHPFNLSPIGTGPYQLASLRTAPNNRITAIHLALSPNYRERYDAQNGYLFNSLRFNLYEDSTAAMRAYESNVVDALANIATIEQILSLPQSQHYTQVESTLGILVFNWTDTAFEERRVRQALSLSLDVPDLVQAHFGAEATYADSPYVPGSSVYQPEAFWTSYDMAQAKTLMSSAALVSAERDDEESTDSEPAAQLIPRFSLLIEDSNPLRGMANDIVSQWQLLGLEFTVEAVDAETLRTRLESGSFQAAIVTQRIGADHDLFRFWHPAQSGNGRNYGAAAQNEIAEILETARDEIYGIRRALLYQQFQKVFAEQAIAIPLFYPLYTFVARDTIEGLSLGYLTTPADRFRGIQDWRPATLPG